MIALWIIGSIIIIITILLNCPATAEIKYINKVFDIKVKYLFINIYPLKEKKEKPEKKIKDKPQKPRNIKSNKKSHAESNEKEIYTEINQSDVPKEAAEEKSEDEQINDKKDSLKDKKDEIFEKIAFFKTILESSKKGLKRIVKGIYVSDINLNFIIANEDACDAAINYGKVNMITFNAISFLRVFFTISIEKVNITCKFNSSDSVYDGQCIIKLRPATVILAAISIFCHYMINTNKKKNENLKENTKS